jgi:hypothetical protein
MSVPRLIPAGAPEARSNEFDAFIFVDQFIDARPSPAVARVEDRDVGASNDPVEEVVGGIKRALEKRGFTFSDTAPVILSGELRAWVSLVTEGLPSKSEATAELYVEVLDPANKRVYSGVYKGYAAKESPGLDEGDVQETLRISMTEAIQQIMADKQLVGLLASY